MKNNNEEKRGFFITLEGIEGVGKSTCLQFLQRHLAKEKIPLITTREPGGTPVAEEIRQVFLNHHEEPVHEDTELLLMFASRAQNIVRVIRPALQQGKWVLSDRFTDATYAYQGGGRGIDFARIKILEEWVQGDLRPDLTILLTAPVEVALERAKKRHHLPQIDRFECEDTIFFQRVQEAYFHKAAMEPNRYCLVDTNRPLAEVEQNLITLLESYIRDYVI